MSSTDNRSRKILIPLATMAVAAAVVVGSGATWTSKSQSSVEVTSGTLLHSNTADGLKLTVSLDANADKTSQGKTASASFDFVTTQLQGESFTSGIFN
jgi:hypothetical protein